MIEGFVDLRLRGMNRRIILHGDVAAQGQGRDSPFGAVLVKTTVQHLAKTDGKPLYTHPATTGHPVVAQLVEGHQHAQGYQESQNGEEHVNSC